MKDFEGSLWRPTGARARSRCARNVPSRKSGISDLRYLGLSHVELFATCLSLRAHPARRPGAQSAANPRVKLEPQSKSDFSFVLSSFIITVGHAGDAKSGSAALAFLGSDASGPCALSAGFA